MCRVQKYMTLAAQEALQSNVNYKHGAVVVKAGKIIAKGHNSLRTRVDGLNYCSAHSEMAALYCVQGI